MDQKIIIFDSPDGTGKTSIAKSLSEEMKIPYFRRGSQHDNWNNDNFKKALEFDQTYITDFLTQTKHSVILDRAYPSEWVYSRVFHRETNDEVLEEVDLAFARLQTIIVIPLLNNYDNCNDLIIPNDKLRQIHNMYNDFVRWTTCNVIIMYSDEYEKNVDLQIPTLMSEINIIYRNKRNGKKIKLRRDTFR